LTPSATITSRRRRKGGREGEGEERGGKGGERKGGGRRREGGRERKK
jgi:hypothetical protein